MSPLQIVSAIFGAASLITATLNPSYSSALVVISSLALIGAVTHLEKSRDDEVDELREEIKKVKDSVEALMIRGLRR